MANNTGKKKLLLVDDDSVYIAIAVAILSDNYDVTAVTSGKEALALILNNYRPDLVLLDILMPEMDGWETFNKLRGISLLNHVPIAFLTSLDSSEEVKHSNEIGAVDLISKLVDKTGLINRIETILNAQ